MRRWLLYLAALAACLGFYRVFPGWFGWMMALTAAGSPLVSVVISAVGKREDPLGLFTLPAAKKAVWELDLRRYCPGDAPSRVLWRRSSKTGELLVRQEREIRMRRRKIPALVPAAVCFAILFCLFPPGQYGQKMTALQQIFSKKPEIWLSLTGRRQTDKRPVMDVVASESQLLYIRTQAYEIYDGQSWRSAEQAEWSVWQPEGRVEIVVRASQAAILPYSGEEKPTKRCLQLPSDAKTWARELAAGKTAEQIREFVRNCGAYDENAQAQGDAARWLAENGRGYCVHFATLAVVLLRGAKIPARLVTGYAVDVQAGLRKTVTGEDAHAWVEFYDGEQWRILEATPTVQSSSLPSMKRENRQNGGWWLLLLPLLLTFKRKENPRLKALRQKATFSREGLSEEEKREYEKLRRLLWHGCFPCLPLWGRWSGKRLTGEGYPLSQKSKIFASSPRGRAKKAHTFLSSRKAKTEREGNEMKQEEKKPITWEVADPKPPIIQSGKMENRKQN